MARVTACRRPTTPRASTTRCPARRRSSATSIPCRTAPGWGCKFGPDIEWIDAIDYGFEPEKLQTFLGFIRSYYPGLDEGRLHPDYTGIRPKLYREGEPVPDFAIHGPERHGMPGLVALYGIESPGLTASLAIGDVVAAMLPQARGR